MPLVTYVVTVWRLPAAAVQALLESREPLERNSCLRHRRLARLNRAFERPTRDSSHPRQALTSVRPPLSLATFTTAVGGWS